MDLVQWLRDRGHADTVRKANALILNRQVRSESHPLGIARAYDAQLDREVEYVNPYVPASLRNTIQVIND